MGLLNSFLLQDLNYSNVHLKQKGKSWLKINHQGIQKMIHRLVLRERILKNWIPHHKEYCKAEKLGKSIENV